MTTSFETAKSLEGDRQWPFGTLPGRFMDNNIYMIYGKDPGAMTKRLLETENASSLIGERKSKIIIKPNFVIAGYPEDGATTHTEITVAVIEYLQENGFENITIAEGSWVGSRTEEAFRLLDYYGLAKKYGVGLVDTKKDRYYKVESHGIEMEVSKTVMDADFIINLPVLKGHCQTLMTHAMKNLKGFLSDRSKRDFHRYGLMKPIAALADVVKVGLVISDSICGDLDFEEGGNPVETNRMMASTNPILFDAFAAGLMGFSIDEIGYLKVARDWGIGNTDASTAKVIELNRPQADAIRPRGTARELAKYTAPQDACSACFASLVHALKRMDDENLLRRLGNIKIAIGQGYKGKCPDIGVGACCMGAKTSVKGCPPKADDILAMLKTLV